MGTRAAMIAGVSIGVRRTAPLGNLPLDFSQIDLEGRTILVKGTQAKTRKRRVVAIADNLLAWLKPLARVQKVQRASRGCFR